MTTNYEKLQTMDIESVYKVIKDRAMKCISCSYYTGCRQGTIPMLCELKSWLNTEGEQNA